MLKVSESEQVPDPTGNRSSKDDVKRPATSIWDNFDPRPEALGPGESWWRDHYQWLKEAGYLLRPRFDPAWIPSWFGTKKDWLDCEDAKVAWFSHVLDATRVADKSYVGLKKVNKASFPYETDIALFVSSEPLSSDPENHCIPVYEVLQVPDNNDLVILVMPFLRSYDDPRFDTVGEVMECYRQILQGLRFMHKHRVAHRDCSGGNIMMDASELYPQSYHPWKQSYNRDYTSKAKHYTRTQRPPKYYLMDFGFSRRYQPDQVRPREIPLWGGDKTVPEFQKSNTPRDPFPTDIYYIGNMIKTDCLDEFIGFEFLEPLVADLRQEDPKKRPTADAAFAQFESLIKGLDKGKLRGRVVYREDSRLSNLAHGVSHWTRRISYTLRGVPPMPPS